MARLVVGKAVADLPLSRNTKSKQAIHGRNSRYLSEVRAELHGIPRVTRIIVGGNACPAGLAGDLAKGEGTVGMKAGDLLDKLPSAIQKVLRHA